MCHPEVPEGAVAPDVERIEVEIPLIGRREKMPALLARPKVGAGPGVLVVADIYGRSPFYEELAGRLALAGFTALLPDFFFRVGGLSERTFELAVERRGRLDESQTVTDLLQSIDWLKLQPYAGGEVGTIGFCLGGSLVLALAAERDDLATVAYYAWPAGGPNGQGVRPLDLTDRMRGPILAFWGDQDAGVGVDNIERLVAALEARKIDFEHTLYPGVGHGFMSASRLDPEHEAYRVACDAWTRTVDFYRKHVAL